MIATAVYLLCAGTSALCAALLWRMYRHSTDRFLMWCALAFAGFAANNALVFADFVVVPQVDLALIRSATSSAAISLLLFGLVWERR